MSSEDRELESILNKLKDKFSSKRKLTEYLHSLAEKEDVEDKPDKPTRLGWDHYFMGLAFAVAQRSEDPSIKHGCVLVSKRTNIILSTGYNGLISGLEADKVDIVNRPEKYKWMQHSEKNAILNSSQSLRFVFGGVKAYITGTPCIECLQMLISVGVNEIYLAKRRGYINSGEKEQKNDFDLLVEEKGLSVQYVELEDIQWLKEIELEAE